MSQLILPRRAKTRDAQTFDSGMRTIDAQGNQAGKILGGGYTTHDGRTVDSTGAFLVGELDRLDLTMHEPLAAVTWGRDIDLREDVTVADEVSSYSILSFTSASGTGQQDIRGGKSWIGKATNQVPNVDVDIAKISNPLRPWGEEIKYTILELESAIRLGRPVDQQKYAALQLAYQMQVDAQVYVGDSITGDTGLLNHSKVTNINNLPNGASSSPHWTTKTADEILADVNSMLNSTWAASGYAVMPDTILLPPADFGYISTVKVSSAGNVSILKYVLENNLIVTSGNGPKLSINPVKWCVGAGAGGTLGTAGTVDRIAVYKKDYDKIRMPLTMLARTPIQYDGIYQKSTYYGRIGSVECVYPECVSYWDGV